MKLWILSFLFVLTACLEDSSTPESALKNFTETRMGSVVTRSYVLDRVTAKMRQSLENLSEEDFELFADMRNVKKDSFKILSKSCQAKTCFITYSIAYKTKTDFSFFSEVKKIAEMVQVDGKWLIGDISNIKTYHESLDPIKPLE